MSSSVASRQFLSRNGSTVLLCFYAGGLSVIRLLASLFPFFRRALTINKFIRQSAERALFAVFMTNLPGYAWMKDRAGRYLYVNQSVKSLTPYRDGWLGKTDAEIWPGEGGADFRKNDYK